MKFCCKDWPSRGDDRNIAFYWEHTNKNMIEYLPRGREYSIVHAEDTISVIHYCPYCGKKLPTILEDEWYEVLKKEYGLTFDDDVDKQIPSEFLTDEWWKKRGL